MPDKNPATPIAREQLRKLVPHSGDMCLLDRVIDYDEHKIECTAVSHVDRANPLRYRDALPIYAGIEYCAQAIAAHGRLIHAGDAAPRRGYLAVIMNTQWTIDRLDRCAGELRVRATKQVTLQQGASYSFALEHQGHTLLQGQAVVALD